MSGTQVTGLVSCTRIAHLFFVCAPPCPSEKTDKAVRKQIRQSVSQSASQSVSQSVSKPPPCLIKRERERERERER